MRNAITSDFENKYTNEEKQMIIMDLRMDNFFAFQNFYMNMSYPKKIVGSYIPNEHLRDRENFRYKKVNILMGGNATGKTSIGKMMMAVCNFMNRGEASQLTQYVTDPSREAVLTMDFVAQQFVLCRLNIRLTPENDREHMSVSLCKRETAINKRDSYESCVQRLDELPLEYRSDYAAVLDEIESIGWMFTYPSDMAGKMADFPQDDDFAKVLGYTLRTLDPAIRDVSRLKEVENTYVIHMNSGDLLMQDGQVIKRNILSSGTLAGIDIASLIFSIYKGECGFYYCDEKFSYVHSELEKVFLTLMIHGLKDNEQLFFTTHNSDILDLPLPKHTYTFLKKDVYEDDEVIRCVYASDYLKKNTDSVRNAVENDLFATMPNVELLYKIPEIDAFAMEDCGCRE